MNKLMKPVFSMLLVIVMSSGVSAQTAPWKLKKNDEGIKVYTRSVEGSKLDEFKGKTTLNAPLDKIVLILKDVPGMKKWVPDCAEAKLLKIEGEDLYQYTETEVPFPLKNRDSIARFQYINQGNGVKVLIEGLPDYLPVNSGLVRIPYIKGHWLLEPLGPNKTTVTYQVHADPGGSIPSWLANASVVDTPFDTLQNLRDYIK